MPVKLAHALAERFIEIREREAAVAAELTAYKALVDLSPCPMALSTKDGVIVYVNRSYCEMLSVQLEDVVVNGWHKLVADRDLGRVRAIWEEMFKLGTQEIVSHVIFKTPNGELKAYWRARQLPFNGYAIAIYHPGCRFMETETGKAVLRQCVDCRDVA